MSEWCVEMQKLNGKFMLERWRHTCTMPKSVVIFSNSIEDDSDIVVNAKLVLFVFPARQTETLARRLLRNLCMRLRWWCFIQFRNALDYLRHRNRFNASLTMRRRQTFANANETRFSKLNLWYYFDDELITASRDHAKWHILLHCLRTCMHGRHWQQKEVLVLNIPCLAVCERIALDKSFLFRFSFPSWRDSMRSHFEFARVVCASLLGMLNPFQSLPFTIANPISAFIEPSFISIKSNCQSIDIIFQRKLSRIKNFDCKVEKSLLWKCFSVALFCECREASGIEKAHTWLSTFMPLTLDSTCRLSMSRLGMGCSWATDNGRVLYRITNNAPSNGRLTFTRASWSFTRLMRKNKILNGAPNRIDRNERGSDADSVTIELNFIESKASSKAPSKSPIDTCTHCGRIPTRLQQLIIIPISYSYGQRFRHSIWLACTYRSMCVYVNMCPWVNSCTNEALMHK